MLEVIQLTPPGRGAVATLRVQGPGALAAVQRHLRMQNSRALADYPADRIIVGRFGDPIGEEVVVRRHGDDAVDLHCHGGLAAAAMVEKTLAADGCRRVGWREWAVEQHDDPIAAAALAALADARTERTAAILLDQYQGALRQAIDDIRQATDAGDLAAARQQVELLRSRAELGRRLVQPWRVVLAGRANVGKSSLMNALAGHTRSIVHHEAGTTRDAVTLSTAIDGWPVELCDTAGLRQSSDELESAGMELARQRIAGADLVVLVFDSSVPWCREDQKLLEQWPEALVVHNKCDLPCPLRSETLARSASEGTAASSLLALQPTAECLSVSALRGDGIELLMETIARRLVPDPPPAGAAVPFTEEQGDAIQALLKSSTV